MTNMDFKKLVIVTIFAALNLCGNAHLFANVYPRLKLDAKPPGDAGEPLILTPYLKNGSINLARNLSRVSLTDKIGFRSHAGFFTVDEKYDSNLYFWYFPSFSKKANAPVLLWLQGGPGASSLFGLFTELGPLVLKKDGFATRKYHWALNAHLIFIDNPVGTGFSFTKNNIGYCTDEKCIATALYNSLEQFFTLFHELKTNDFFITGESYAGKYIPSLAMEIHRNNVVESKLRINLKGMAIGSGYCDPINQLNYGAYLYQHGLIDFNQLKIFNKYQKQIVSDIMKDNWVEAGLLLDQLMDGDLRNFSYFKMFTGFNYYYNFLQTEDQDDMSLFTDLLNNNDIRRSVHVGGLAFNDGHQVLLYLLKDLLKSVSTDVSVLLSEYRVLFFNGQLDIIVAYPLTVNFLRNLNFTSADDYRVAARKIWRVGDDIAGYVKRAGNLTEVLVRNAGHMVPRDQPKWAFDLITRFVKNKI